MPLSSRNSQKLQRYQLKAKEKLQSLRKHLGLQKSLIIQVNPSSWEHSFLLRNFGYWFRKKILLMRFQWLQWWPETYDACLRWLQTMVHHSWEVKYLDYHKFRILFSEWQISFQESLLGYREYLKTVHQCRPWHPLWDLQWRFRTLGCSQSNKILRIWCKKLGYNLDGCLRKKMSRSNS